MLSGGIVSDDPFHAVGIDALIEFVRRADKQAWPDGLKPEGNDLPGFMRTTVVEDDFVFVDLFGGAKTDIGLEAVFWQGRQIWGAVYRGGLTDPAVDLDEAYAFLAEALAARPADALPVRGPDRFEARGWTYVHRLDGTFGAFTSIERMRFASRFVYERITLGGWSGDHALYGPSIAIPRIPD
jgi:hypothetical protein